MLSRKICVKPRHYVSLAGILRRLGVGLGVGFACAGISGSAHAQQPYGWSGHGHTSAYVLEPGEIELTGNLLRVNDTLDVFDVRADVLQNNTRLGGKTGDFKGNRYEISAGVLPSLNLFYRYQQHDLTAELSEPASLDLESIDTQLSTEQNAYGLRWVFFESASKAADRPWRSASLELARIDNKTDDFGAFIQRIRFTANTAIEFRPPQRFTINRMQDQGWRGKVAFSQPLTRSLTATAWLGYADIESTAGTSSEISSAAIANAFLQTFDIDEQQLTAGASIKWFVTPRLPLSLSYEYTNIRDRELIVTRGDSSVTLPSFLRADNLSSETKNHVLTGNLDWWVTPNWFVGVGGTLMSNQFMGTLPHYNNPLSGSFGDTAYGYAELRVGIKLSIF